MSKSRLTFAWSAILAAAVALCPRVAYTSTTSPEAGQATTGRVVATVTTLEGVLHLASVDVELRAESDTTVMARTATDGAGMVTFPEVPPGRYILRATRPGFVPNDSAVFQVRAGEVTRVLVDIRLTFETPTIDVRADAPSPTNSVQPVSMSDMLAGPVLEVAPLEGDDFQSLLQILPGVVRGPDGRLRIKGGQPTQGALQMSSASLIDPSTGDFDLDLPGQSVESVEVLSNPFAAEYGRFSTSVTQIRTKRGTNEWEFSPGNLMPRIRKSLTGLRAFEPRVSLRGPLQRNRAFFAQDFQFRHVGTPVRSLPDEPEIRLRSFDSFTRLDTVLSARHTLGGGLIAFPREIKRISMNTFRPPDVTPEFSQHGWSTGIVDRFAIARDVVFETTVSGRWFEVNVGTAGTMPMVYAPLTQAGSFFNEQERDVRSFQWVESLSVSRNWRGQHVFKVGTDLQWSEFDGFSISRPVEVRRVDGTLAERTTFGGRTSQDVRGAEFAVFAQDRWRLNSRLTFELGLRADRDAVVKHVNWSPRAGVAVSVTSDGRSIVRGGVGRFVQRTPLNVEAFPSFEHRVISRFASDGSPLGQPVALANVLDEGLRTPGAYVGNAEWNHRFGRRVITKFAFLRRRGSNDYIITADPSLGRMLLSSSGRSRYQELEATTRYLGGERRDVTVSYVWSRGTADLNNYDQFYGNLRNPIVPANEHNLIPTDVRHRVLVRATVGLPAKWVLSPVIELRSGFPWSAVDEFERFVGPRNRSGRLPVVRTVDFSIARPWRYKGYRFNAGLKLYNVLGASAERDVQNHLASPDYGTFHNPIERSVGFVLGMGR